MVMSLMNSMVHLVGWQVVLTLLGQDVVEVQLALRSSGQLGPRHFDSPLLPIFVVTSPSATSHCIRTVSRLVAVAPTMELMAWVLVKVGVAIVELIPGPLLGIVRDSLGTFYLLLVLVIGILLLVLKVSIRAGTGAQLIKSALIPNDIGLANLLGWVLGPKRILTVVIMALLKVPSY